MGMTQKDILTLWADSADTARRSILYNVLPVSADWQKRILGHTTACELELSLDIAGFTGSPWADRVLRRIGSVTHSDLLLAYATFYLTSWCFKEKNLEPANWCIVENTTKAFFGQSETFCSRWAEFVIENRSLLTARDGVYMIRLANRIGDELNPIFGLPKDNILVGRVWGESSIEIDRTMNELMAMPQWNESVEAEIASF